MGGCTWIDLEGKNHSLPGRSEVFLGGPLNDVAVNGSRTYGAALARCEALIEAREKLS